MTFYERETPNLNRKTIIQPVEKYKYPKFIRITLRTHS